MRHFIYDSPYWTPNNQMYESLIRHIQRVHCVLQMCIHIFYDYILMIRIKSVIGQHPQITDMFFIKPYLKCTVKHLRTSDSSGIMCSINNTYCISNSNSKRVNLFLQSNTVNQKEMLIVNLGQCIIGRVNDDSQLSIN